MDLYHHRNDYLAPYSIYDPMTGAVSAAPTSTVVIADDRTIDNLSGRAGIQYQPANNLNFYASFSRGYKGPAANNTSGLMPGQNAVLYPEIATAYAAGFKLRLLDNRLALNGAAYHPTLQDLQVSSVDPNQAGVRSEEHTS